MTNDATLQHTFAAAQFGSENVHGGGCATGGVHADMCAAFVVALFLANAPRRTLVDVKLPPNYAELVAQVCKLQ